MQNRMTVLRREGRSLLSRIEKALANLRKAAPRLLGAVLIPPPQPRLLNYTAARSSTASVAHRKPTNSRAIATTTLLCSLPRAVIRR